MSLHYCIFNVYSISLRTNTFHACLQFRLKLMCKQDYAGNSSSKRHWTVLKNGFRKPICSKFCLSDLPRSVFLLSLARTQSTYLQCRRRDLILDSCLLDLGGVPGKVTHVHYGSRKETGVMSIGMFPVWLLCFLLLINPLWATSMT